MERERAVWANIARNVGLMLPPPPRPPRRIVPERLDGAPVRDPLAPAVPPIKEGARPVKE